jgi:hypothetical protein
MIRFVCVCAKKLSSQEGFSGEEVKCPSCGRLLVVPQKDGEVAKELGFSSAALISFFLSLVPFALILLAVVAHLCGFSGSLIPSAGSVVGTAARVFRTVSFYSVVFVQPLAIVLALIGLSRIRKSEGLLRGEVFAGAATIISACWLALLGSLVLIHFARF